jgi:hypothetical protein
MNEKIEKLIPIELYKDNYNKFDVLGLSVELTNKYEFDKAFELRKIAEQMDINDTINNGYKDKTFFLLEEAIITHIFYNESKYSEEYSLYEPIKHYINELIENAEIVEHEIINKKVPDIFLSVNNEFCVGEVKPHNFTDAHVNQLRMYIQTYGTRIGYAFGIKLTGKLDNNMIFINIEGIKDRFYRQN